MTPTRSFSWRILGLVIAGGAVGVAARAALLWPFAEVSGLIVVPTVTVPIVTAIVNVVGASALGLVVGVLGTRHPSARAFLGTGILGGFTTYSAFAVQLATLPGQAPWLAVAVGLFSLVVGFFAAGLGVGVGRRLARRDPAGTDAPEEAE